MKKFNISNIQYHDQPNSIRIGLAGDVMLGRLVNEMINQQNYRYVWGTMLPLLHANDIVLINLETALTHHMQPVPKVFNFRSDPNHVQVLREGNITAVNLANNHILDFGIVGLQETLQVLDDANILHIGAGMNEQQARQPIIVNRNHIRIGIIGATDNESGWAADKNKPGIFYFDVDDYDELTKAITLLKTQVDIVIVSLHWGPNMRERPTIPYINCAHALINAGADVIQGHSAHLFQGIEIYNKKLILYDTGDFVDDYHVDPQLRNDQSFLYRVIVVKECVQQLELIPVIISNMQVNKAMGSDYDTILDRMRRLSAEFGTQLVDNKVIINS